MHLAAVLATLLAEVPAALAEAPVPTAVELARVALPRSNWDQLVAATGEQIEQAMAQAMAKVVRREGVEVPADFPEVVAAQMRGLMGEIMPSYEEMLDFQAGLLQKHYTAAELGELLAFYRSPLGQKAIRITPEVMRDAMGWMQAQMQVRLPAAVEKMTATFRAYAEEHAPPAKEAAPAKKAGEER